MNPIYLIAFVSESQIKILKKNLQFILRKSVSKRKNENRIKRKSLFASHEFVALPLVDDARRHHSANDVSAVVVVIAPRVAVVIPDGKKYLF